MPSTITVSWSGPGNLTARHYYYVPSVANPENPVIWYYVETTGAQWTTNSTITLPANCVIYNLKISNSNGAVGQSVTIFGYQMNATGKGGIINTLNNKVKNSSFVHFLEPKLHRLHYFPTSNSLVSHFCVVF